jgi:hypothetical protein
MIIENEIEEDIAMEAMIEDKDICFVIMPFRGWHDRYYREIYRQAIFDAGLEPRRADDLFRPATIVKEIWELTKTAKILLADLSGKNPNVMYELGLAHAITKPVVLVTESMEDVPFDLRALRVLEYDKNAPRWADELQANITQALQEVLENPIAAVPTPFLEVKEGGNIEVTELQKQLLELRHDIDMVKRFQIGVPQQIVNDIPFRGTNLSDERSISNFVREALNDGWTLSKIFEVLLKGDSGISFSDEELTEIVMKEYNIYRRHNPADT